MFLPYKKATLLLPTPGQGDIKHLNIILTNPCQENHVLLISITTIRDGAYHDDACVLSVGDHPFIKHDSYVFYNKAEKVDAQLLIDAEKDGIISTKESLAEEVFARVVDGVNSSMHMTPSLKKYFDEQNTSAS